MAKQARSDLARPFGLFLNLESRLERLSGVDGFQPAPPRCMIHLGVDMVPVNLKVTIRINTVRGTRKCVNRTIWRCAVPGCPRVAQLGVHDFLLPDGDDLR